MESRELIISEAGEHLLGVFRALLDNSRFRDFVDKNFVIKQYYDGDDGKILRVEIKDRVLLDEDSESDDIMH
tara:strand:- start:809 stop:1024 length:216 start_codon:yes stop_codon:yes gene_type:complete